MKESPLKGLYYFFIFEKIKHSGINPFSFDINELDGIVDALSCSKNQNEAFLTLGVLEDKIQERLFQKNKRKNI